jgi:lipid II:glycine glycyltransferase (peptidoglycan interpeptide bridge formation enzyme)
MNSSTNAIFQKAWWLDAVAPGQWREAIVTKNNKLLARMPYVIKKQYGFTHIIMPHLTQTLGTWLMTSDSKNSKQLSQEIELMNAIIEQLPAFDYFHQNFHYSITNWLPFYWNTFTQMTRYTYVIEDLSDLDKVWSQFEHNTRNVIRKASSLLCVCAHEDIERFIDINELTFKRQGIRVPYSREFVRRLDKSCADRNARKIFFAVDPEEKVHAAIYLVWDENSGYYLMSGTDPKFRNSGANSLLLWEGIKFMSTVTKRFDFEGSMIKSVEHFFRGFGGTQKPYFSITKLSPRMKVFTTLKELRRVISFKN